MLTSASRRALRLNVAEELLHVTLTRVYERCSSAGGGVVKGGGGVFLSKCLTQHRGASCV